MLRIKTLKAKPTTLPLPDPDPDREPVDAPFPV